MISVDVSTGKAALVPRSIATAAEMKKTKEKQERKDHSDRLWAKFLSSEIKWLGDEKKEQIEELKRAGNSDQKMIKLFEMMKQGRINKWRGQSFFNKFVYSIDATPEKLEILYKYMDVPFLRVPSFTCDERVLKKHGIPFDTKFDVAVETIRRKLTTTSS